MTAMVLLGLLDHFLRQVRHVSSSSFWEWSRQNRPVATGPYCEVARHRTRGHAPDPTLLQLKQQNRVKTGKGDM